MTATRHQQAREQPKQGRFARPIGPNDGHALPRRQGQTQWPNQFGAMGCTKTGVTNVQCDAGWVWHG
jgi:hypothetical protein